MISVRKSSEENDHAEERRARELCAEGDAAFESPEAERTHSIQRRWSQRSNSCDPESGATNTEKKHQLVKTDMTKLYGSLPIQPYPQFRCAIVLQNI